MSLVGTRPPTVDEWKQYEPYHRGRLAVKPGLTGMWQVSGRSDITDFEEVVKLDMEYVKNWNKLYIYGSRKEIRSSRKLAESCKVNLEVKWLMGGAEPDFRTISDFRKDNIESMES